MNRHFTMKTHWSAAFILLAHLIFFGVLSQFLNPHPDLLDHWVWSRALQLSYYEHPPMIAFLLSGLTLVLGHAEWVLELGAQLANLTILLLTYAIAQRFFGKGAALLTLLLLCSTLYYTLGSLFLHITQPFVICWLLSLYALCRFHQTHQNRWLLYLGIFAGLGALSKYIMLLFYMGMGVHGLIYPSCRKHFFNPWLYGAGCLSLLIFSPVLLWNYQNQWVSFIFQFTRGLTGAPWGLNTLQFTLGHLLLFSPVWSWWCFRNVWKKRHDYTDGQKPESVILVVSLFPLLFFTLMSLRGEIADPHWANVSYIGLMILAGKTLQGLYRSKKIQVMLAGGILLNFALVGLVWLHVLSPLWDFRQHKLENYAYLQRQQLPPSTLQKLQTVQERFYDTDRFLERLRHILSPEEFAQHQETILKASTRTLGDFFHPVLAWEQTAQQIVALLEAQNLPLPQFIISQEYQLSSALSFFLPEHPWPHSLEKPERNQWSAQAHVERQAAILVCDLAKCHRALAHYHQTFHTPLKYLGEVATKQDQRTIRLLEIYLLQN